MSNPYSDKYVTAQRIDLTGIDDIFACPKCGMSSTCGTYLEFTYEFSNAKIIYSMIECIGDHPPFPVPFDWLVEYLEVRL